MAEKIVYLNLQEQVAKNKQDIEELRTVKFNLERAGVRVVGEEASPSDLPDPASYAGELGDAYLIGTQSPYDMYVYTQPSVGESNFKWFNLGPFPAVGPRGPQGEPGAQGPRGDAAFMDVGITYPAITDSTKAGDLYLNTTTGMVFQYNGTSWIAAGSIRGPRGPQGVQGPQGPQGERGMQGPQGIQGASGMVVEIIGVVNTIGSLPDPDSVARNAAYILESGEDKDLYIIVEESDTLTWYNAGPFTGTPGDAAGFGTVSASASPVPASSQPTVEVTTTGPDTAKNFQFDFEIPVGADIENTDSATPSQTKGYTQSVIAKRTIKRVITNDNISELGLGASFYTSEVCAAALNGSAGDNSLVVISNTGALPIVDAPNNQNGMLIIYTDIARGYQQIKYITQSYNEYLYYGSVGSPIGTAIWHRVITTQDVFEAIGVPEGGAPGQILEKKGVDDYDTQWVNPPHGIPAGGSSGQYLKKNSGTDYDATWTNPPQGIPAGGSTGQVLKKNSNTNYDASWGDAEGGGLPEASYSGQVVKSVWNSLQNKYEPSFRFPFRCMPENMLINPFFEINQRNKETQSENNKYCVDRWKTTQDSSYNNGATTGFDSTTNGLKLSSGAICQYIEISPQKEQLNYLILGVTHVEADFDTVASASADLYYKNTEGNRTYATPIANYGITPSGSGITQYIRIYDISELSINSSSTCIEFCIGKGASGATAILLNAFCYNVQSYDDITMFIGEAGSRNRLIPVTKPHYATEIEKCKYYYEKITTSSPGMVSRSSSTSNRVVIYGAKKRIFPTKEGISATAIGLTYEDGQGSNQTKWITLSSVNIGSADSYIYGTINDAFGIQAPARIYQVNVQLDAEIYSL